jgi:hypothetical protein
MKNNIYKYAFLLVSLVLTQTAFADVKIKTRQTSSGQSSEYTTFIKGKRQRTERDMGAGQMINLTQCDLRRGVQLNSQTKTYFVNSFNEPTTSAQTSTTTGKAKTDNVVRVGGTVTSTITVKDTGERKQMFGFTARHLIITMKTVSSPDACNKNDSKMEMDGWYIDAEFYLDCEQNYAASSYANSNSGGCQDKYQVKTIGTAKRGYALYEKMTIFGDDGKELLSTVNEVVELSKATLDASLFDVPQGYREVKDAAQMYSAASDSSATEYPSSVTNSGSTSSGMKLPSQSKSNVSPTLGAKQPGVIRVGVSVKSGSVGDGVSAADLTAAVQNTLGEHLKGTKIELIPIEAKLSGLIDGEAKKKECDYILYANVSHKKGGGGFGGMFSSVIAPAIGSVGLGHTGSVAGNVAGQVATHAIVSAGTVAASVKSKDEITLEVKLNQTGGAAVLSKQYKNKAKSNGQDIISPLIQQLAMALVEAADV